MRTTIKDIAREARVSISTVTYALHKQGKVTRDSHKRVLEAAERLGYIPDPTARSLVGGRTNSIGVITPVLHGFNFSNPYYMQLLSCISKILSRQNCWMSLYMPEEIHEQSMRAFLMESHVDGLLWLIDPPPEPYCQVMHRRRLPYITLAYGTYIKRQDNTVILDDRKDIHTALAYLQSLGHHKILFLSGHHPEQEEARREAYVQYMEQNALQPVTLLGYYQQKLAYEAVTEYWGRTADKPTAILAASDTMALGAIHALHRLDVSIPEQVSVMGYDDIPSAAEADPPLTTMAQPLFSMAERACGFLFDCLEQKEMDTPVIYSEHASLVIRRSTGPAVP